MHCLLLHAAQELQILNRPHLCLARVEERLSSVSHLRHFAVKRQLKKNVFVGTLRSTFHFNLELSHHFEGAYFVHVQIRYSFK